MIAYLKKEKVLCIALVLALASMLLVAPDAGYAEYVDVGVLALLFSLMLLVKGFQSIGMFDLLIEKAFGGLKGSRGVCRTLVLMCFFTSMLITNDVALITFVPFAILALDMCGQRKRTVQVVVLQTIAANLGSMATPIGNPQNLYLFSASGMELGAFFGTMLPPAAISLALLMAATLLIPDEPVKMEAPKREGKLPGTELIVYAALFAVNLLVVFRVLHWAPALLVTVAGVVALKRWRLLKEVDYALLLTFVGFFIFVGNLGRVPQFSAWLENMLAGREVWISVLFSQFLSNVPAALLLSGFTEDFSALLVGTNVGGLGTLIASMASLISYKLYAAQPWAEKGKFMLVFTGWNLAALAVLLVYCLFV